MNADGSNQTRLTVNDGRYWGLVWSPVSTTDVLASMGATDNDTITSQQTAIDTNDTTATEEVSLPAAIPQSGNVILQSDNDVIFIVGTFFGGSRWLILMLYRC